MEILDAASRVFQEKGVEGTTMQDVATAAELSKGALYLHFANKEALFGTLLESCQLAVLEDVRAAASEDATGLEKVGRIGREYVRFIRENRAYARTILRLMAAPTTVAFEALATPTMQAAAEEEFGLVARCVEEGIEDGSIAPNSSTHCCAAQRGAVWFTRATPSGCRASHSRSSRRVTWGSCGL